MTKQSLLDELVDTLKLVKTVHSSSWGPCIGVNAATYLSSLYMCDSIDRNIQPRLRDIPLNYNIPNCWIRAGRNFTVLKGREIDGGSIGLLSINALYIPIIFNLSEAIDPGFYKLPQMSNDPNRFKLKSWMYISEVATGFGRYREKLNALYLEIHDAPVVVSDRRASLSDHLQSYLFGGKISSFREYIDNGY